MAPTGRQSELANMIDDASHHAGIIDVLDVYGQSAEVLGQISAYLQRPAVTPFTVTASTV